MSTPVISLLHPSARPLKWAEACQNWYDTCTDPSRVEYVFVPEWDIDRDRFKPRFPNTIVERNTGRPCLVDGFNKAAELSHGQILVGIADDFFAYKGWDEKLLNILKDRLDKQVVVWASTNGGNDDSFIVHPIMTRPYYERYGYWFWPEYNAWYADNELYEVAQRDGVILDARQVLHFDHRHPSTGRVPADAVNHKQDSASQASKIIFNNRKIKGFPRAKFELPVKYVAPVVLGTPFVEVKSLFPASPAPKLTLMVCSVVRREAMLERLLYVIRAQVEALPNPQDVEVLYAVDSGKMSIGKKRNLLIESAHGDYVCFVDDDDRVWGDYVVSILSALETYPDCVGMCGIMTTNGARPTISYFSSDISATAPVVRPCHLSPILRSIASSVKFLDTSWGEDRAWSDRILPLLHTIVPLKIPVYHYDFRTDVTETQKPGIQVGHNAAQNRRYHYMDDPITELYGLPDFAIANLIYNESVSQDKKIAFARHLKSINSPKVSDPFIASLLVEKVE